jgi:hypothetical protein
MSFLGWMFDCLAAGRQAAHSFVIVLTMVWVFE